MWSPVRLRCLPFSVMVYFSHPGVDLGGGDAL